MERETYQQLAGPFGEDEIEFLPRAVKGDKALAIPYLDARAVMNRLDRVVGAGNWSFAWDPITTDGKMVRGKLTVLGVTYEDAGEAATEDELLKSAVSDALKRCAVHVGIGRYLYALAPVWAPYDSQRKRWTEYPKLEPRLVQAALRSCGVTSAPDVGGRPAPSPTTRTNATPAPESSGDQAASKKCKVCGMTREQGHKPDCEYTKARTP